MVEVDDDVLILNVFEYATNHVITISHPMFLAFDPNFEQYFDYQLKSDLIRPFHQCTAVITRNSD